MSTEDANTPTYPALRNLEAAQQQVAEDLRAGFRTEEELFAWLQEVIVVTFGYIRTDTLQAAYGEDSTRKALMTGDGFSLEPLSEVDISKSACREFRLQFEEMYLNPAFQKAYRDLRANANEYIDAEGAPDPLDSDAPVALRPSLDRLNKRQEAVLQELLDGFEKEEQILDWGRRLNAATYGELPTEILSGLRSPERPLRDHLLNGDQEYSTDHEESFRQLFASKYLLPAFNDGVRTITGAAGERSATEDDSNDGHAAELGA